MNRFLLTFATLLSLGLSACSSHSDGGPGPEGLAPSQPPKSRLLWGELPCQKKGSCKNPALNQPLNEIVTFFQMAFQGGFAIAEPDEFHCGEWFREMWNRTYPEYRDLNEKETLGLHHLASEALDTKKCEARDEIQNILYNYTHKYGDIK